jgi:hypothetical protein
MLRADQAVGVGLVGLGCAQLVGTMVVAGCDGCVGLALSED